MEQQTLVTYIFAGTFFAATILHNFMFGLFGFEEAFFFFMAIISAFLFPLSIVYNVFTYMTKRKPRDVWKLGFLGLIGLLGLIPAEGLYPFTFFYGFFGLFAFFGLKK